MAITVAVISCERPVVQRSSSPAQSSPALTENEAIAFLEGRGHSVAHESGQTHVSLSPKDEPFKITMDDIEAINALSKVVAMRTMEGIEPEAFQRFRVFPELKQFTAHYAMPEESLKYLNRFPNVEEMRFWGDDYGSFESFPAFRNLRILHHEAADGEFFMGTARRIAACRSLEEIIIQRPIPPDGIHLLRALPNLKFLAVHETIIIDKDKQGRSGEPATDPTSKQHNHRNPKPDSKHHPW